MRNRNSLRVKEKHDRNKSITSFDIGNYEIENESENILSDTYRANGSVSVRTVIY